MLRNYFKIAWRAFVKDRTYATINLIGLAIALACVLMIGAYVGYELSFDKWYSNSNRIYRVVAEKKRDSLDERTLSMPNALAYTLKEEFPEIEAVSKIDRYKIEVVANEKKLEVETILVDSTFFQLFNLPFIVGNAGSSLATDRNIVLSESAAKKYFPDEDPIGKKFNYIRSDNTPAYFTVSGIIKDIPSNTHFQAEGIIANTEKQEPLDMSGAYSPSGVRYIMLKKGANIEALNKKIPSIYEKYNFRENTKIIFQSVTSIYLYSDIKYEPFKTGNVQFVYIFSIIALLILFVACINYINLTTARSLQRVKEVGMRKVMGASKKQLVFQFISESIILFFTALPIAFLLAWLLWPSFASLVKIEATNLVLLNGKFLLGILITGILAGSLSGAYPAFFLSRLKPIAVLKDWKKGFHINLSFRKALIVFQFVITIGLIVSTIVVHKQLHLLNNMELGFNNNYLLTLLGQEFKNKAASFKNELKAGKDILDVSYSSWNLERGYGATSSMEQTHDSLKDWNFGFVDADIDFFKTMQMKLIAGRNFTKTDLTVNEISKTYDSIRSSGEKWNPNAWLESISSVPIIITKTTKQNLGLKNSVIGEAIKLGALQGTVIGEINDFKGLTLLEENPMVVIRNLKDVNWANTYIRINSKNIPETIDFIKQKHKAFFPDLDFKFSFMDDEISKLYEAQQRLATLFTAFATLAITISLLGLFSLVALISRQRTKEIGIRKVLGASVLEIIRLLSGSFIRLILIAFVIAIPLVWVVMTKWLQNYQYRTEINWWIFLIVGAGSLSIALMVVAAQAFRSAVANPVEALRTE